MTYVYGSSERRSASCHRVGADLIDRSRKYIADIVAKSGNGGHDATFKVALQSHERLRAAPERCLSCHVELERNERAPARANTKFDANSTKPRSRR